MEIFHFLWDKMKTKKSCISVVSPASSETYYFFKKKSIKGRLFKNNYFHATEKKNTSVGIEHTTTFISSSGYNSDVFFLFILLKGINFSTFQFLELFDLYILPQLFSVTELNSKDPFKVHSRLLGSKPRLAGQESYCLFEFEVPST